MVPWWGVAMAFFAGVVIGVFLLAIVSANSDDERNGPRWYR